MNKWLIRVSVILSAALLLCDAENFGSGVQESIKLCYQSVIPSLYPFCVLSLFTVYGGIFSESKLCDILSEMLFGLKGDVGCVSLLSLVCGYPVGAKLIDGLYLNGKISKVGAQTLLLHCVNPGPAFLLTLIGKNLYHSESLGIIFLFSELSAAIITARIHRKKIIRLIAYGKKTEYYNLKDACIKAVSDSGDSILKICLWVLLFGGISAVLKRSKYLLPLSGILEVTFGVHIAKSYSPYLVSFLIGFGGLSVQLQVISAAKNYLTKPFLLFFWKTLQGVLCAGFTCLLITVFKPAIAVSNTVKITSSGGNPYFSAVVLLLFVISTLVFLRFGRSDFNITLKRGTKHCLQKNLKYDKL